MISKHILRFYVFYLITIIGSSVILDGLLVLVAFVFIIPMLGAFAIGERLPYSVPAIKRHSRSILVDSYILESNLVGFVSVTFLLAFLFSVYAIKFYTGLTLFSVFQNLIAGRSNYILYQTYFSEANIGQFSLSKIPAILSLFGMKLIQLASFFRFVYARKGAIGWVFLISTPNILFSLARGTTFELFEFLIAFYLFLTLSSRNQSFLYLDRRMAFLLVTSIAVIAAFFFNVGARVEEALTITCRGSFCMNETSLLSGIVPEITKFFFSLFGYFGFGVVYVGHMLQTLGETFELFSIFFPFHGLRTGDVRGMHCSDVFQCSTMWTPTFELYLIEFGLFFSFLFFIFLGFMVRQFVQRTFQQDFFGIVVIYLIFLIMISLPVGSFYSTSSANILLGALCFFVGVRRVLVSLL